MVKWYTDKWGYEVKIKDYSDWSDFKPWKQLSKEFDWQAETEIQEQDIIAFRDNVEQEQLDGSILYNKAARLVIARVANIIQNDVYLEVAYSDGKMPFSPADKIKRGKEWLFQYGVYRWPRNDTTSLNQSPRQTRRNTCLPIDKDEELTSRFTRIRKGSKGGKSGSGSFCIAFGKVARRHKRPISPPPRKPPSQSFRQ